MAKQFACPYLGGLVELTEERERHIAARHRELAARLGEWLAATVAAPERVGRDPLKAGQLAFLRQFSDFSGGRMLLVVVVTSPDAANPARLRHWIVTAYPVRDVGNWSIEWTAG